MGGTASKPEPPAAATLPPPAAAPEAPKKTSMLMALCPYAGKETTPAIAAMCPVASSKKKEPEPAPTQAAPAQAAGGECPVRRKPAAASGDVCPVKYKNASAYNVYGQKLDPANMMPSTAQQLPVPGQAAPMQTNRVVSGIARGGTEDSWVYPSEQMFYNSLVRKGKGQDVKINDVSMMVAIHNNMNEKTWRQLLVWEKMHCATCDDPRLLRFTGRPDDLSPKARIQMLMGAPEPFDRHDWVVDRCGTEVRYIIDYYHDASASVQDSAPKQHDLQSKVQINLDVRPALDSPMALWDRCRFGYMRMMGQQPEAPAGWPASCPPENHTPPPLPVPEKEWSRPQKAFMAKIKTIAESCASRAQTVVDAAPGDAMERAVLAMDVCVAQTACSSEAKAFLKALEKGGTEDMASAHAKMLDCNARFKGDGEKLFKA
ncbi:cytochrome c/c1 heme lyase-domain-containing protein [Baffinella frigidus]|nr:cytochrome c/c1 heme lyase-domain-containing protein [Cryptophyta sp. CCMP2293]